VQQVSLVRNQSHNAPYTYMDYYSKHTSSITQQNAHSWHCVSWRESCSLVRTTMISAFLRRSVSTSRSRLRSPQTTPNNCDRWKNITVQCNKHS